MVARRKIVGVVIHRGEIPVSNLEYHILVQRDGTIVRLLDDAVKAPHARQWNASTLAICVFGDFASAEPGANWTPTEAQYAAVIAQIMIWNQEYGPLWVKGHSELGPSGTAFAQKLCAGHTCPGENFDLERVRASQDLGPSTADPYPEPPGSIRV